MVKIEGFSLQDPLPLGGLNTFGGIEGCSDEELAPGEVFSVQLEELAGACAACNLVDKSTPSR